MNDTSYTSSNTSYAGSTNYAGSSNYTGTNTSYASSICEALEVAYEAL